MYSSQKLGKSEIPRETHYKIRTGLWNPFNGNKILCPQAFWVAILENVRLWRGAPQKYMICPGISVISVKNKQKNIRER